MTIKCTDDHKPERSKAKTHVPGIDPQSKAAKMAHRLRMSGSGAERRNVMKKAASKWRRNMARLTGTEELAHALYAGVIGRAPAVA